MSFAISTFAEHIHGGQPFSEAEFYVLAQTGKFGGLNCEGGLFLGKAL